MSAIQRCLKENIFGIFQERFTFCLNQIFLGPDVAQKLQTTAIPNPSPSVQICNSSLRGPFYHATVITGSFFYCLCQQLAKKYKNYNSKKDAQLLKIKGLSPVKTATVPVRFLSPFQKPAVARKHPPPQPLPVLALPEEVVVALVVTLVLAEKSEVLMPRKALTR